MAVSNSNKAIIAFKNLLGKSQTDSTKELGNEAEGIFFNITADNVFIDFIDPIPATAVTAGVAIAVTGDFVEDNTSNGHGWFLEWPVAAPAGTDPTTTFAYAYGAGLLTDVVAGDRIRNIIAPNSGVGYELKPKDTGVATIPPGDPRDWVFQYNSGAFWQQDNVGSDPGTADCYAYVGTTLGDSSGGGGAIGLDGINVTALVTTLDGDKATLYTVAVEPVDSSYIMVDVNGKLVTVGDGDKTRDCYFSGDGGTSARGFGLLSLNGKVQIGDELFWNGSIAKFELDSSDKINIYQQQ